MKTGIGQVLGRRGSRSLGVALVLVLAGFLFTTSAQTANGTQLRSERADLVEHVREERARVLEREAERRAATIDRLAATSAGRDSEAMKRATAQALSGIGVKPRSFSRAI